MATKKAKREKTPQWQAGGPYLGAALICERVLQEADNVWSAMRIIDHIILQEKPPETKEETRLGLNLTMIIMVKSGSYKGKCSISLSCRSPKGDVNIVMSAESELNGGEHGVNIRGPVVFPYDGTGLYWFSVNVNGKLMSKIPFRVSFATTIDAKLPESKVKKP